MKAKECLRRCPFCGENDIELGGTVLPGETEMKYRAGCPNCGVWFDWLFATEDEAREAWNNRQPVVVLETMDDCAGDEECNDEPF